VKQKQSIEGLLLTELLHLRPSKQSEFAESVKLSEN